jgi:glycosyltransferase involved in cell wall biosynthesis
MRIALVIAGPYPAFRGSQVLVSHLASGLRQRGHDVCLVTYGPRRGQRPGPRPGRMALDVALIARLWRAVRRERIEVIHAHNYEAGIAALLVGRTTGRPVVFHGHSALADELPLYVSSSPAQRVMGRLGRLLDTQVPRRADGCVAVSEELGVRLRRAGVADQALACIEPAVAPVEVDDASDGPGADGVVCYAGNLDGYQNLDFLLDGFARVRAAEPAARLVLVSHPDARGHAGRLAARGLGPAVEIVLAESYADVRRRLRDAAVTVCPRTERSGFPMKLLTYQALGRVVVACAGSAKGLVDGVTGRVVPDGDVAAFADAVVSLLRDPATRRRLGRAGRRAVGGNEAWERMLGQIESIYRQVLAVGAGGRRARAVPVAVTE